MTDFVRQYETAVKYAAKDHSTIQMLAAAAPTDPIAHAALLDELMGSNHPLRHVAEAASVGDVPPEDWMDHNDAMNHRHRPRRLLKDTGRALYGFDVDLPERLEKYPVRAIVLGSRNAANFDHPPEFHEFHAYLTPDKVLDTARSLHREGEDSGVVTNPYTLLTRLRRLHPELFSEPMPEST